MICQKLQIFKIKSIEFNLKSIVALVPVKSMVALMVMKHLMNMMTMVKTMTIMILSENTMKMKTVVIRTVIKMVKMGMEIMRMVMVQQQQQGMKKQLQQEQLKQGQLRQGQLRQGQLHLGLPPRKIAEGRGLLHPPLPVKRPRLQPYLKGQMLQIPCLDFQWYYIQTKKNMARL